MSVTLKNIYIEKKGMRNKLQQMQVFCHTPLLFYYEIVFFKSNLDVHQMHLISCFL